MKIITVTNRKGGVGKTTMAVHIAAGLANRGLNVGLIDTDSQGHAALFLDMEEENGLFQTLIEKQPLEEVVRIVPPGHYTLNPDEATGNLFLLPSSEKTYKIPYELDAEDAFAFLEMAEDFAAKANLDVIVIDTNPTLSMFDGAVYMATDGFIYVTECEALSFDGIAKATEQVANLSRQRRRYLQRETRILGVIPNKLKANTVLHRKNIAELAQTYTDIVWSPITHRIAWAESAQAHRTVYVYAPDEQEATDANMLADNTLKAIQSW